MRTVLIMLAALPLLAAGGSSSFSGRVYDGNGSRELADAIVTVTTPNGYISSTVTNKEGQFSFANLPSGEYNFRVTARGFAIYERDLSISSEAGVRTLDVRLLVPADKQTVSVSELRSPNITRVDTDGAGSVRGGY